MDNRINVLDNETSNKIAAGEVVERPLSVVKELIENSIDAKAKNITIEIEDGGQKLIRVIDDGIGIHFDDIRKAFMEHGTSKINSIEDVYKINTLGFRGEALPSIASISKLTLTTYREGSNGGSITFEGGIEKTFSIAGTNKGTMIEVRDLFYNVPARLKFMKTPQREGSLIADIVNRIALSHPDISFKFYNNGKRILLTLGNDNLKDVIRSVYGKSTIDNLIYFENITDTVSVYGYVGNMELARGSRNNQSVFINKRYIKNKLIGTAVENAVKSFFTINKFPFFILFLDIYSELIDVNVHPTKSEVKFNDDKVIFSTVFHGVHNALKEYVKSDFLEEEVNDREETTNIVVEKIEMPLDFKRTEVKYNTFEMEVPKKEVVYDSGEIYSRNIKSINEETKPLYNNVVEKEVYNEKTEYIPIISREPKFPKFKVIGQILKTYIVLEGADSLILLDQHAAHEKILFEKYFSEIKSRKVHSQILLSPEVIQLPYDDFIIYTENNLVFKEAGFLIEEFGGNSIVIKEVPIFLGKPEVKDLFLSILDNIKKMASTDTIDIKYNKIATLACRSAVKANDKLTYEEMDSLVEQLRYIEDPFNCPHGRPTMIKITNTELEKRFKRIQ
ncbi:DNA mismatch repair protein MutL [Clostridium bornimense]|uniref:DNA mismatch repair protein MutL n=1 Tax=Clostridium bornimense TaxID=1216932 RepID=W6S288_9CLOT|nr:DNA mismatch repair endonuclease MutL [Clostridium bornimense]CDM68392.1 DNA mismatch repair protein MutL [Clostridium bornimense]